MENIRNCINEEKREISWIKLETEELINLKETLFSGQVFNFHNTDENEYTGSIYFFVVSFLQKGNEVYFKILHSQKNDQKLILLYLESFFALQINYKKALLNLKPTGLRLIQNSLLATLFSFICSANNNVKRISKMVNFLYTKGKHACFYKGQDFYLFPDLKLLAGGEEEFRNNGFGYRAGYVSKTAKLLLENEEYLEIYKYDELILKGRENKEKIRKFNLSKLTSDLLKLSGVGPKVRDCISLMGLGLFEIVPIDTHIFKHAKKLFKLEDLKLTTKNYKEIQDKFLLEWGEYAGIYQLFVFKEYLEKNDL